MSVKKTLTTATFTFVYASFTYRKSCLQLTNSINEHFETFISKLF